ncbi:hypothetical protein ACRWPT_005607 [Escherichia coli]
MNSIFTATMLTRFTDAVGHEFMVESHLITTTTPCRQTLIISTSIWLTEHKSPRLPVPFAK